MVNGAELKEWLEWSAGQFNQIDPAKGGQQQLINNDFPTNTYFRCYRWCSLYRVSDATQPKSQVTMTDKATCCRCTGKPDQGSEFSNLVNRLTQAKIYRSESNNYRASCPSRANTVKRIVLAAPDENRQVIIDYIRENKTINPAADGNWSRHD